MSNVSIQLNLSKDTGRCLMAEHGGADFWFDKQQIVSWSVEGGMVSIELDEKAWQRRLRTIHPVETPNVVTKTRKCLCCGKTFQAEKQMFVCTSLQAH